MDKENTLYLDLDYGRVVIEMLPDVAPNHVARIKELTRQGFYDGIVFHRVIARFMARTPVEERDSKIRTSVTGQRTHLPPAAANKMS